ncbi:hypothetical protein GGQ59_000007 [Parvularcula dongshanensis]|uniref:Uncharacterized protein n=1 Tax=Parvularcula dongshanensis TaxID=1173995 RepID=A0A840HYI1_9PROT|nr:hypothetical protein [Parvularcula dongshanensis]
MDAEREGRLIEFLLDQPVPNLLNAEGTLVAALRDLVEQGNLQLSRHFTREALAALPKGRFFHIQQLFCSVLPHSCEAAEALLPCIEELVLAGGEDLAAGEPVRAFADWLGSDLERADAVLDALSFNRTPRTFVNVLKKVSPLRPVETFEQAYALSASNDIDRRLAGFSALGVCHAIDADAAEDIWNHLATPLDAVIDDREIAVLTDALAERFKEMPDHFAGRIEKVLQGAIERGNRFSRFAASRILFMQRDALPESAVNDLTIRLARLTTTEEGGTVQNLMVIASQLDADRDRLVLSDFILAMHQAGTLKGKTARNVMHGIERADPNLLAWHAARLLLSEDGPAVELYSLVAQGVADSADYDTDLDDLELNAETVEYLGRRALGFLFLSPPLALGIVAAVMRKTSEEARIALGEQLFDVLLRSYPGMADNTERIVGGPEDLAADVLRGAVAKARAYLSALKPVRSIAEFRPSERQRFIQAERQADFWRDIQRNAHDQSDLLQFITVQHLLYGSGSVTHVDSPDGSETRRMEVPMQSHSHEMAMPRLEGLDPVGLNLRLFMLRASRRPE